MKHLLAKVLSSSHLFVTKSFDRLMMYAYRSQFAACGKNVNFYPLQSYFYYKTIEIGNNVYIGPGAMFLAKTLRFRWDVETILEHEKILYQFEERITKEELGKNMIRI